MSKKRRKKSPTMKAREKLWGQFALYIKLKHSPDGVWCRCYTCGNAIKIGESVCNAGHWLAQGAYPYHRFTEDNVRPQCSSCNVYRHGEPEVFRRHLIDEVGEEKVEEMFRTRKHPSKRDLAWYLDKIEHYKKRVDELRNQHDSCRP